MEQADLLALTQAAQQLETASITTRISQTIGLPIEKAMSVLPGHWSTIVSRLTKRALEKALDGALFSLDEKKIKQPSNKIHKFLAITSGAIGGAFGIGVLAIELPISATLMLRSIADIARSEGEDLRTLEAKIACLSVFALSGGGEEAEENANTSYYAVRSFLSKALSDTTNHIVIHGFSKEGAPALVKIVNAVSTRLSIPISEKLAAQTIPAIGLVGGASINLLFMNHFQQMAHAHFTIRRLERRYGEEKVKQVFIKIVEINKKSKAKQWTSEELEHKLEFK
ncbi:MAG: EcsC family protein [Methylococcaceae bacterium]|nr:EcsC family protein [Methylococcaceae bacterium]